MRHSNMTYSIHPISYCPFCGTVAANTLGDGGTFWVECRNPLCGACGPVQKTLYEACKAWDTRVDKDDNGTNIVYRPEVIEPEVTLPRRKR